MSIAPKLKTQRLRHLRDESIFTPGTVVEVSCNIDQSETVWVPAKIVKEMAKADNKKQYMVKFCNESSSSNSRANLSVDSQRVRPTQPPFWVEEYQTLECVEVFHDSRWRKGVVQGIFFQKQYMVCLEATKKHLMLNYSDLRPLMEWENGVWKIRQSPSAQESESNNTSSKKNVSVVTKTSVKQTNDKTQGSVKITIRPMNNQKCGNEKDSIGDKKICKDNNPKRKIEENNRSYVSIKKTKEKDTTMVWPFEKKLPIWKRFESMEVFRTVSRNPHFSPLVETGESSRETAAVGMMLTFYELLEELKHVQLINPVSTLESLSDSFAKLEKHGFDVKASQSRIQTLLSLKNKQTEKMKELNGVEKEIVEKESEKVEIEQKILELQRRKEETIKELIKTKSRETTIYQELGDVDTQFQKIASTPW